MNTRKPITPGETVRFTAEELAASATQPPAGATRLGTHLYVCTNCKHEEWKKYPREDATAKEQVRLAPCEHCGHELQERFPQRVDLTAEDQGLMRWLATELRVPVSDVLMAGLLPLARDVAAKKAARGKTVPQWLADRLQKKPGI